MWRIERVTRVVGCLVIGLFVGAFCRVVLQAQTPAKVTAADGWHLCVDTTQPDLALTVKIDALDPVTASGVTWQGNTARIPLAQLPAPASAIGLHTAIVTTPDQYVVMADGSTQVISGGALSVAYEVIATTAQPPSNPRWIKGVGLAVALVWLLLIWHYAA